MDGPAGRIRPGAVRLTAHILFALVKSYLGIPDMRDSPRGTSLTGNSSPLGAARSLRW